MRIFILSIKRKNVGIVLRNLLVLQLNQSLSHIDRVEHFTTVVRPAISSQLLIYHTRRRAKFPKRFVDLSKTDVTQTDVKVHLF